MMKLREERIADLLLVTQKKSHDFENPPMIVIGGYALRAHIPFARYSRDCDFALPKQEPWAVDSIPKWFPDLTVESSDKKGGSAFLRLIQPVASGKRMVKVSLDFMEGEVVDRSGERIAIDDALLSRSIRKAAGVAGREIMIRVPAYEDYLLLKLLSARPSDVRDIAALVWHNGLPPSVMKRADEVISDPAHVRRNLELVIREISDPRFIDSWRGTFITEEFAEADKKRVLAELKRLNQEA